VNVETVHDLVRRFFDVHVLDGLQYWKTNRVFLLLVCPVTHVLVQGKKGNTMIVIDSLLLLLWFAHFQRGTA
jgi:hypothetical protein